MNADCVELVYGPHPSDLVVERGPASEPRFPIVAPVPTRDWINKARGKAEPQKGCGQLQCAGDRLRSLEE